MASSKYYSFLNFLLFCKLLQKIILISAESNCLNPTFEKNQKIVVDFFFNADAENISPDLCQIIFNSNGLISMVFHMCSDLKDKATCVQSDSCLDNRRFACFYKHHADLYNACDKSLPNIDPVIADCVCEGSADDILTSNETARINYGIQTLPALVLNQKYDPCFTDYSYDGMKAYFCKAYKNELDVCKN